MSCFNESEGSLWIFSLMNLGVKYLMTCVYLYFLNLNEKLKWMTRRLGIWCIYDLLLSCSVGFWIRYFVLTSSVLFMPSCMQASFGKPQDSLARTDSGSQASNTSQSGSQATFKGLHQWIYIYSCGLCMQFYGCSIRYNINRMTNWNGSNIRI